jgi:hypothetical protein
MVLLSNLAKREGHKGREGKMVRWRERVWIGVNASVWCIRWTACRGWEDRQEKNRDKQGSFVNDKHNVKFTRFNENKR